MVNFFLLIGVLLTGIAALLYFAPKLRILNFVDYHTPASVIRINRYAAARLLLPVCVSAGCAYIVEMRPELAVPLLFPVMISILVTVVWIAAGLTRLKDR
ncbi:hypothetical protein [Massilia sp. BSC265]|uniref:hypothetical protein n=1 Tax=Massilia sp. BSC265 TaxID=1549812 RepID=UPI0004E8B917|nr:hypothetical protein [Massilia sp. BSC265]KFI06350.1 hypothetical protein JN27_16470 [Massilia sp. BSC265]